MKFKAKIKPISTSNYVLIPASMMKMENISVNDIVEITVDKLPAEETKIEENKE